GSSVVSCGDNRGRRQGFRFLPGEPGRSTGNRNPVPQTGCGTGAAQEGNSGFSAEGPNQRLDFFADCFPAAFLPDFFAIFVLAPFFFFPAAFLAADFLTAFFAFLVRAALTPAADFFAFFAAFATAFTGADLAAAFLMRPTTAFAAVLASMVAPLTTR